MKQRVRRLIALVLAMAMSLSLLSVNVWAQELEPTELDTAEASTVSADEVEPTVETDEASTEVEPEVVAEGKETSTDAETEGEEKPETLYAEGDVSAVYQWGGLGVGADEELSTQSTPVWATDELRAYIYEQYQAKNTEIDVSSYNIPWDECSAFGKIALGVINEHPNLYYMSKGCSYSGINNYVRTLIVSYNTGYDDDAFQTEAAKALAVLQDGMSDVEKAVALHDYLAIHCSYAYADYLNGTLTTDVYNAYGVLVNRSAVCQGYALTYKYLCNQAGIKCLMVSSDNINHAWNLIQLNGKYYQVDVTWDDPTWDAYGLVRHNYLFRSDNTFNHDKNGATRDWVVEEDGVQVNLSATDTTYDTMYWTSISSPMVYDEGNWYYVEYNSGTYQASLKKSTNLLTGNTSATTLQTLSKWYVFNGGGSFWQSAYAGLFLNNGRLYYNDYQKVYSVALDGSDLKTEYSVDTSVGHLYGCAAKDNTVYVARRQSPQADSTTVNPTETTVTLSAAHVCAWGEGVVTTPATCTKDGVKTFTCSCGQTKTVTIPATGHALAKDEAVPATCTADGKKEGSHCSVCNTVLVAQETIPATGHSFGANNKCTVCGESQATYTVTVTCNPAQSGMLTGGGTYAVGSEATVVASLREGFSFAGWYNGSNKVCDTLRYTFTVNENTDLTAQYTANTKFKVDIIGENGGKFTVGDNGTVQTKVTAAEYAFGTKLVLHAADASKVNAWLNGSNKRLGSAATLSVTVTGNMTIKLAYKGNTSGQAMVEYVSGYDQIIYCKSYSTGDTIVAPVGATKAGYRFVKWEQDEAGIKAQITAGKTHITVKPVYEAITTTHTVKVKYPDGTIETVGTFGEGTTQIITAKELSGKTFSCWKDATGKVVSYSKSYYLMVLSDITLTAVYDTAVEAQPVIVMSAPKAFVDGGANKVSFTALYDVPEGYTLQEMGVVRSIDAKTAETLVIGGENVKQHISTLTTAKGAYTYTIRVDSATNTVIYARGYLMVVNNATGNSQTIYTDVMSGSYNSAK